HNTVFSFFSKIGQIGTLEEVISFEITFCGNSRVSKSTLKSTSRAGANGATASPSQGGTITSGTQDPDPHPAGSERGQSDQQADRSIQGAGKIAGSNGSSNVNPGTISNLSGNRQTAQTSEGNIQIAAAFNLNIMKNIAAAYITGNLVIEAVKDLIITSVNLTEAKIYANASATQSKIGVGAAVAINIVTYENLAYVDQAKVKAENLTIKATMPEAAATTTPSAPVQENIVRDTVEKVIKDALNELTEQMGLSTIFGEENSQALTNMLSELLGEITGKAAQTLLTGTGLEQLLNNDVMTKLEERFNALPSTFEAWLKTCPQGTKTALINVLKTAVLQNVLNMLAQRAQSWLTPAGQTPGQGSPSVANPTAPVTLGADLQKLGLDTKTALGQEMLLMATNLSQNLFEGLINVNTLKTYLAGDIVADLRTKAAKILQDTGRALSTAALDSLSSWLDLSIKQKDKGPTHTFVTQAIAGAGASNVGVAGSVAISVVSGKTKAYIGDSAQTVVVEKDMIIQADASQSEDTTSSAAVGSDGKADKNLAAGSADTTSGSSDITHQGSTNGNLVIAPSTNGAVTASKNGNKVTVTGSPDEGYTLGYVTAAVTSTGTEITVLKNANGTYEFTIPTTLAAGETITISSVFVADLKDIVIRPLKITTGTATAVDNTVGSIFVITDSTPAESSTFSKAKMNDRVVVRVVPKTGYRLKEGSLQFVYTINNQEYVKKIVVVENPNTNAYVFYMPDAIVSVEAIFEVLPAGTPAATQTPVTNGGMSVGVGASFALDVVDMVVEAGIGKSRPVSAGSASITAEGRHYRETVSVAGTDPISGENASGVSDGTTGSTGGTTGGTGTTSQTTVKPKDISVDASVAIGLSDIAIKSYLSNGASVTTTGKSGDGDFTMEAVSKGYTLTQASGFAAGSKAAVGAAVAVNIADSKVEAIFEGNAIVNGDAVVRSYTYNEDDSKALATAVGADIERYLSKFKTTTDTAESKTNKVLNGDYAGLNDTNTNNQTASGINNRLNENSNNSNQSNTDTRQQANNNLSISSNVLNTQHVATESTEPGSGAGDASSTANKQVSTNTTSGAKGQNTSAPSNSIQVAAAVGLNITNHIAKTLISGNLVAQKSLSLIADNDGNFRTMGSGATMTLGRSTFSIAMGVAVSVNNNKAHVIIADADAAKDGIQIQGKDGVVIDAELTQNMDGEYRGYLGAQALAGSISGQTQGAIAGAIAVLVSHADTKVNVGNYAKITGGDIRISASDKSKLAIRAGGISIAKNAKVGVGASFAFIYAQNGVTAKIGDNVSLTGNTLTITAEKRKVDFSDYENQFGLDNLLTDSTGATDVDPSEKGIIDMKKNQGTDAGYTISINLSTDTILDSIDLLNFLSSTNYYAEAISGAVSGGAGSFSGAGSFAMIFFFNTTSALIGKNVVINLTGDMEVKALADTTARIIAGSLSASSSNIGAGITLGFLLNDDLVLAQVGEGTTVNADGSYTQKAESTSDILVVAVAAAVAAGGGQTSIGGTLDAIVLQNEVIARVDDNVTINANGDVLIHAGFDSNLILVAASISGTTGQTAVGGTINVIVTQGAVRALLGNGVHITAKNGDLTLSAATKEKMISVLASASASSGGSVAGVISVFVSGSTTQAKAGKVILTAGKDVNILADAQTKMLIINASLSASGQNAVGMTVSVNVLNRVIEAILGGGSVVKADGNVLIQALAKEQILMVIFTAGASAQLAIAGNVPVVVNQSSVRAEITDGNSNNITKVTAGDSIGVIADASSGNYFIAGGLAGSGSTAVGATISTAVVNNTVKSLVGSFAQLVSLAVSSSTGIQIPNREEKRKGVVVYANAQEDIIMVSIGAAASGSTAVSGVINTLVVKNVIQASVREHGTISAGTKDDGTSLDDADPDPASVSIQAKDDTMLINLAGSLAASGSVGVGATVVVLVFNKEVKASADTDRIYAAGDVSVTSDAKDDLWLLAITFAASGSVGVAGGVNTLVFQNAVNAYLAGIVKAGGKVHVHAGSDSRLINVAAAVGAGGTAGVTGVAVVTYFYNETVAYVKANAAIQAKGDVTIEAISREFVTSDAAGASGAGTAAVGGTLDVVVTKVVTKAYTENGVSIEGNNISVKADDKYELIAVVGTVAVGGVAGVGVSVLTTVSYNTVTAEIGTNNVIRAAHDVSVTAASNRKVQAYVLTAGGGQVGVSGSVAVVVAGSLLSEDAHNGIYASNEKDGETMSAMDPQTQVDGSFAAAHPAASDNKPKESLTDLLASDGESAEDMANKGNGNKGYDEYGQNTSGDKTANTDNMNDGTYDETADGIRKDGATGAIIGGTQLEDTTTAVIRTGSTVTAGNDISVTSDDQLNAYMVSGTLAVGVYAGVGVGVTVAVLYSNVQAVVESNVTLKAGRDILIHAASGSTPAQKPEMEFTGKDEQSNSNTIDTSAIDTQVKDSASDNEAATSSTSTIFLVGVVGSGGIAGVSVSVATLIVMTKSYALMAGNIIGARNVTIEANMSYGTVLTITLAAAGGVVGANGTAAVTYFEGRQEAGIAGTARLSNITGTITVRGNGTTNATAISTAVAGGATAVNVLIALAINRSRFDTYIGQGVVITESDQAAINMDTKLKADASAGIVSAAIGGTGVGVSVAIAINRPEAYTYIGFSPADQSVTGSMGSGGHITVNTVSIKNHVDGTTKVAGLGVAGGGVAVNGAVALAFNRIKGYAAINKMNVTALGDILIQATMDGDTLCVSASVVAGSVAVGATVALAQLKSENKAFADTTGCQIKARNLTVLAGTKENPYDSETLTTVITGAAGGTAVAVNFAVALNSAANRAVVTGEYGNGTGNGLIVENLLSIQANGRTKSYAISANAGGGLIVANVAMVWATIQSIQEALLTGTDEINVGGLLVTSVQNSSDTKGNAVTINVRGDASRDDSYVEKNIVFETMAEAYIFSASAGQVTITANTAVATADATSRAKVSAARMTVRTYAGTISGTELEKLAMGSMIVKNTASSIAKAHVDNLSLSFYSIGLMVGFAYAKGTFEAILGSTGEIHTEGNLTVDNTYDATAETILTPSLSGINASYASVGVNLALADVSTKANTGIDGNGKIYAKAANVSATGTAYAHAKVVEPVLRIAGASVAANSSTALLKAIQKTFVTGTDIIADSFTMTSYFNKGRTEGALAELGGNGGKVTLIGAEANVAVAEITAENKAYTENAGFNLTGDMTVKNESTSYAKADLVKSNAEVGFAGVGVNVLTANAKGTFTSIVDIGNKSIKAGKITITTTYHAKAEAATMQPGFGITAQAANLTVNTANASMAPSAEAALRGNGTVTATGEVKIGVYGNGQAIAKLSDPEISISGIKIGVNQVKAVLEAVQKAYLGSVILNAGTNKVTVESEFNKAVNGVTPDGAKASVGDQTLVNASFYSAYVSVATANANVTGEAYADGTVIQAGDINITSIGTSIARAEKGNPLLNIGLAGIGVLVMNADAAGTYRAYWKTIQNTISQAANVTIKTAYTSNAYAVTVQPKGGLGASLINVDTNTARATSSTKGEAAITGGGTIKAASTTVEVDGEAEARAEIADPQISVTGTSISANTVYAEVKAEQKAYVKDAVLKLTGNLNVISRLNEGKGYTAVASPGDQTFGEVSLKSAVTNVAEATNKASGIAYIENASVSGSNVITVKSVGTSKAIASKGGTTASFGIKGIGILVMRAYAQGIFKAYMIENTAGKSIEANKIDVLVNYVSDAFAISSQPTSSVKISLVSGNANVAFAEAKTEAEAYITANQLVKAQNNITVKVEGSNTAKAEIQAVNVSISGLNLAINLVTALVSSTQRAFISGSGRNDAGVISVNGSVYVQSLLNKASATAKGGSNGGTVEISIVGGSVSSVTAKAYVSSKAYIQDAVVKAANKVEVKATAVSTVNAAVESPDFSLGLVTAQIVEVHSDSYDTVLAYIGYAGAGSFVEAKQVDVLAVSTSTVNATGSAPAVSIALADGSSVQAIAEAAKAGTKVTKAYIDAGCIVRALGLESDAYHNLNVKAESSLTVTASANKSTSIGAISLGEYDIETKIGTTETAAYINGEAFAIDDINISAKDYIKATSSAEVVNGGLIATGTSKAGNTVTKQNAWVGIGNNAYVYAYGIITAEAKTESSLSSTIGAGDYGLGIKSKIYAFNTLKRVTEARIGDHAQITSVYGNIIIRALAAKAAISTIARGYAGSAYTAGGPKAVIDYTSNVKTQVGNGTTIKAVYGQIEILAEANSDLYAYAYRKAAAIAGSNTSDATITSRETVQVLINENGSAKTTILGEDTRIGAYIVSQKLHAYSVSYTAAAGSNTRANATITEYNTLDVKIGNAYVGGIETLNIEAIVENFSLKSQSYSEIVGVTGKVYSYSTINGYNHTNIVIGSNAELAGKVISIIASAPAIVEGTVNRNSTAIANTIVEKVWTKVKTVIEKIVDKVSKIPFIGWLIKKIVKKIVQWIDVLVEKVLYSDAEAYKHGTFTNGGDIAFNGSAHIGGGSAGTFIDILDADGSIYFAGLDSSINKGNLIAVNHVKKTITINQLFNNDVGTFNMSADLGNISGRGTIYGNSYLPNVNVVNHSDYALILKDIQLINAGIQAPNINTNAAGNDTFGMSFGEEIPRLTITSLNGTDVTFGIGKNRETDLGEGILTIYLNGGSLYTEKAATRSNDGDAFVAANKLYVYGASQIGKDINNPFRAYIFELSSFQAISGVSLEIPERKNIVVMNADGSIYAELTLVKVWMTDAQMKANEGKLQASLNLDQIIAGKDIRLNMMVPQSFSAGRSTGESYEITVPRSHMQFVSAVVSEELTKVAITQNGVETQYWLNAEGMIYHKTEDFTFNARDYIVNEEGSMVTYLLPNGATVIVDKATGKLLKVVQLHYNDEDIDYGGIYDFTNMEVVDNNGKITITITGSGAEYDQKITFDENGVAYMAVGVNGVTTYIESGSDLGWMLPNGIKIFYKQAFVDQITNEVVEGKVIKIDGTDRWLLLDETLNEDPDYLYHVVKVQLDEKGVYIFVEGYVYTKTAIEKKLITDNQTLEEAKKAAEKVLGSITNAAVKAEFDGVTFTPDPSATDEVNAQKKNEALAQAIRDYIIEKLTAAVTGNIKIDVSVTLKATEAKDVNTLGLRPHLDHTDFTTAWEYVVKMFTGDVYDEEEDVSLSDKGSIVHRVNAVQQTGGTPENPGTEYVRGNAPANTVTANATQTKSETGVKEAEQYESYSYSDTVYLKKSGDSWVISVTNGNRRFEFALEKVAMDSEYLHLAALSATENKGKKAVAYAKVKDLIFHILSEERLIALIESASGEIADGNYNGGYIKGTGDKYTVFIKYSDFLADKAVTKGIMLINDKVLAVFPDGTTSFVATEIKSGVVDSDKMSEETVSVAPGMVQKEDSFGQKVYSDMQMTIMRNGTMREINETLTNLLKEFSELATLNADENIVTIGVRKYYSFSSAKKDLLAKLEEYLLAKDMGYTVGARSTESRRVDSGDGSYEVVYKYIYDEESTPIYVIQNSLVDNNGNQVYEVYVNGTLYNGGISLYSDFYAEYNVVNGRLALTDQQMARLEYSAYRPNSYERFWDISFVPATSYLDGAVVLTPIVDAENKSTGCAEVTFKGAADAFAMAYDKNGYAIIDRFTRVVDTNTEGSKTPWNWARGTILYLDKEGSIVAYLTPDGIFRAYNRNADGTYSDESYTQYESSSTGFAVTVSKGTPTYFMELAEDVWVSIYGLHDAGGQYDYDNAHYYGYDAEGILRELKTGWASFEYVTDESGDEKLAFVQDEETKGTETGKYYAKTIFNSASGYEKKLLSILNNDKAGNAVYIMSDKTTIDSEMNISTLAITTLRNYLEMVGDSEININEIKGEEVTIKLNNPTVGIITVNGSEGVDVKTDIFVVLSEGDASFGTEDKHLVVNPSTEGGTVQVMFRKEMYTDEEGRTLYRGDYNGFAYIDVNGNVRFKDSVINENAHVEFDVYNGNAAFSNITLKDQAQFILDVINGTVAGHTITAENLKLMGSAKLTITSDFADAELTATTILDDADLSITLKKGNVTLTNVAVTGDDADEKDEDKATVIIHTDEGNMIHTDTMPISGEAQVSMSTKQGSMELGTIVLSDGAAYEADVTDGSVTLVRAEIPEGTRFQLNTHDTNAAEGMDGNLVLKDAILANGAIILDLSGSFLAEKDGVKLLLGDAVYGQGSRFNFGGDVGSKAIPLTVDVVVSQVPFRIESVDNIYIKGAEIYDLDEDFDTPPHEADGEQSVTIEVPTREIISSIDEALKAYEAVLAAEDATADEKAEAQRKYEEMLSKLAILFAGQLTVKDVRNILVDADVSQEDLDRYDSFVAELYKKEVADLIFAELTPDTTGEETEEEKQQIAEDAAKKKIEELETDLQNVLDEIQKLEEALDVLDKEINDLTGEQTDKQEELKAIMEELTALDAQMKDIKDQIDKLRAELLLGTLTPEEETEILEEIEELTKQETAFKDQLDEKNQTKSDLETRLDELKGELEAKSQEKMSNEGDKGVLEGTAKTLEDEKERMKALLTILESEDVQEVLTLTEKLNLPDIQLDETRMEKLISEVLSKDGRYALIDERITEYFDTDPNNSLAKIQEIMDIYNSLLSDEKYQELLEKLQEEADKNTPAYTPDIPAELQVELGISHGETNISNYGTITVTQQTGDITVGIIETNRSDITPADGAYGTVAMGDVILKALQGSIIGAALAEGQANITAANIDLWAMKDIKNLRINEVAREYEITNELKQPGSTADKLEKPVVTAQVVKKEIDVTDENGVTHKEEIYVVEYSIAAYVDYTGRYVFDENAATHVNAAVDQGSIELTEIIGDLGVGMISAPIGNAALSAAGSILDTRTDAQKAADDQNITAGGNANLNAQTGTIGTAPDGTIPGEPLHVQIGGTLTADAQGDIVLKGAGNLTMIADTQDGKIYASAEDDLRISNTLQAAGGTGDMTLVRPVAGGNLTINTVGNLDADIVSAGENVVLISGKKTTVNSVLAGKDVNIAAGTSIEAGVIDAEGNAYLSANGELRADTVEAKLEAVLSAGGKVEANIVLAGNNAVLGSQDSVKVNTVTAGKNAVLTAGTTITAGTVTAGTNASLTANGGDIIADDTISNPLVKAENIQLYAAGNIGSALNPYRINLADKGKLTVKANAAVIKELDGDITLVSAVTTDDLTLIVPGSIYDGNGNLMDVLKDAEDADNKAQDAVDKAETDVNIYNDLVLKPLEKILEEAKKVKDEAEQNQQTAEDAYDKAADDLAKLQKEAEDQKKILDAAIELMKKEAQDIVDDSVTNLITINKAIEDKEAELGNLDPMSPEYETEKQRLETELAQLKDQQQAELDKKAQAEEALSKLAADSQKAENIREELDNIKKAIADKEAELTRKEQELDKLEQEKQELEEKLADDPDNQDLKDALKQNEQDRDDKQSDIDAIKNELDKLAIRNLNLRPAGDLIESGDIELTKDAVTKAEETLKLAKDELDKANEELQNAQDALDKAQADFDKAQAEFNRLNQILTEAKTKKEQTGREYEAAKDAAAQTGSSTVGSGGNLNIETGGSVGEDGHGLSADVDGKVTIHAGGDVNLTSKKNLNLNQIISNNGTGKVSITTEGTITDDPKGADTETGIPGSENQGSGLPGTGAGSNAAILAGTVHLNSTGSDVGEKKNPLTLYVDEVKASGTNVYLENGKNLNIDSIHAKEEAGIKVDGDVLPKNPDSIITADRLEAEVTGNLGNKNNRLPINADKVSVTAENIYLDNISENLEIEKMEGTHIDINTSGHVNGSGVNAEDLIINANGHIGSSEKPLGIYVTGKIDLGSKYGDVFYLNSYKKENPKPKPDPDKPDPDKPDPSQPDKKPEGQQKPVKGQMVLSIGAANTSDQTPFASDIVLMILALGMMMILWKKRNYDGTKK
ncbi:MAG: hypothetical protein EOM40_04945, partial [Clostridia bacterium]|nr:hypothetical protein [Clostridia bacterium]